MNNLFSSPSTCEQINFCKILQLSSDLIQLWREVHNISVLQFGKNKTNSCSAFLREKNILKKDNPGIQIFEK